MKKQILIVASVCLVIGLAVIPAPAQAVDATWEEVQTRAMIPFSFVVLGKTFPAGEYRLIAAPHTVRIEDANGIPVATVLANEISDRSAAATGQLIFHCYSDRCFLSELRSPTPGESRQFLTSRSETRLAKQESRKQFAVLGGEPLIRQ
jgi:hypothetical protein